MKFRTFRTMFADDVRSLCIRNHYCTNCTTEEYNNLLDRCNICPDDNDILLIALTILKYSDLPRMMDESGCNSDEVLESIAFNLLNFACRTMVDIEQ